MYAAPTPAHVDVDAGATAGSLWPRLAPVLHHFAPHAFALASLSLALFLSLVLSLSRILSLSLSLSRARSLS